MQKIAFLVFLYCSLLCTSLFANDFTFELEKHQKYRSTFSGDINQDSSIHLILFKDKSTSKYGIKPFYSDSENNIQELNSINLRSEPTILSYHLNINTLSISFLESFYEDNLFFKELSVVDIDILSGEQIGKKTLYSINEPKTTIRLPNKTLFIDYDKTYKNIEVIEVFNGQNITKYNFPLTQFDKKKIKKMLYFPPIFINTNEYVEEGSINQFKVYYQEQKLFFDFNNTKENEIYLMQIDLKEKSAIKFNTLNYLDKPKIKNANTFFYQNKLFAILRNRERLYLKVWDAKTRNIILEKKLDNELSKQINIGILNEIKENIIDPSYNLIITVNESIDKKAVVRIGCTKNSEHRYHPNWWFHHQMFQQQIMMQQQMMMQNTGGMPGFGPMIAEFETYSIYNSDEKVKKRKQKKAIYLVFDKNLSLLQDNTTETQRRKIDHDRYLEKYDKSDYIKSFTTAFTRKTMRSILYLKKTKNFQIRIENIE